MTLCGILKKISKSTDNKEVQDMAGEAIIIAKKMDAKLKEYSSNARKEAQDMAGEAAVIAEKMDAKLKEYSSNARRKAQTLERDNWQ